MREQTGQIILILLLVMTVALGIGLSVVSRSLVDVSTSSKIEQSGQALSAAQAGLERILRGGAGNNITFEGNKSEANISGNILVPPNPARFNRQIAIEYPPLSKEEVAHVWFADYNSQNTPPDTYYDQRSIEIFWGQSSGSEQTAVEVTIVYYANGKYQSQKNFFDSNATRAGLNNFTFVSCSSSGTIPIRTTLGNDRTFYCTTTISSLPANLMLMRVRPLYNTSSQPFAVRPGVDCPQLDCKSFSLPPQAKIFTSKGTSGQTERVIQLFTLDKVVPFYLDYAIFSAGKINK